MNLNYAVVSKRKIAKLIDTKVVSGWDDPRLFTLSALRRRGVPAAAVNLFCSRVGVTMSEMVIDPSALDACTREVLNVTADRTMAILNPLKVHIKNFKGADRKIEVHGAGEMKKLNVLKLLQICPACLLFYQNLNPFSKKMPLLRQKFCPTIGLFCNF